MREHRREAQRAAFVITLLLALSACTAANQDSLAPNVETGGSGALAFNSDGPYASEHNIRKKHFQELSVQSLKATPRFYEYLVKQKDVPSLPGDMPVLRVVFEERVFFDTGLWAVRPEASPVLDVVAAALREEHSNVAMFIAGHTDSRGSDVYNLDLSVKRADSVAKALQSRGVGPVTLWRVGFGKSVPLRLNDSPENMAQNRRVEFIMSSKLDAAVFFLKEQGNFNCSEQASAVNGLCKEQVTSQRFVAVPVQPKSASGKAVRTEEVHPLEIKLNPPTKEVGAPTR
jgi:outer membrane protein OmpA-like peptidoglycan-associated protein